MSLAPITWVILSRDFSQPHSRRGHGRFRLVALDRLFPADDHFPALAEACSIWLACSGCTRRFASRASVYILRRLPETKGKTLEEIEKELVD